MSKILKSSMIRLRKIPALETAVIELPDKVSPKEQPPESPQPPEEHLDRERGYREGYEEGFEEGRTEGFEKGYLEGRAYAEKELTQEKIRLEAELGKKIKELDELLASVKKSLSEAVLSLDREVLDLLKLLTQKLLFKESLRDEALILRVIREALKEVVEGARVVIKVNPREAEFLKSFDLKALSEKSFPVLSLEADSSITPGGCLLETNFGLIDATLERRWEEILKALEEASKSEG